MCDTAMCVVCYSAIVYIGRSMCVMLHMCVPRWVLSDCLSGSGTSLYIEWSLREPGGEAGSNICLAILDGSQGSVVLRAVEPWGSVGP